MASFIDFEGFLAASTALNRTILDQLGWLFTLAPFGAVLLVAAAALSPIGAVRIGGDGAKPILSRWSWFSITLCTTIATGILFWGAAEPIMHLNAPPGFAGADARSDGAAHFALSTLFMHWSITPYAIYAVPALAFALAYYNLGTAYSLSGPLKVLFGRYADGAGGAVLDALALFALVAGVAASLGAGILTLADGMKSLVPDGAMMRALVTILIVATYVASSVTGLQKGIKILSALNVRVFFALAGFVFIAGPSLEILKFGAGGLVEYVREFLPRSLNIGGGPDDGWLRDWTMYYFANWMAWAPITALFLGRISVGYTVREFLLFNLVAPAVFGMVWMTIFAGAALHLDLAGEAHALTSALQSDGPEAVIYALFGALPWTGLVVAAFLGATFISFVTAMDSNTHSIASICLKARRQEDETHGAGLWIKIFWGVLIGAVAFIMTATKGVDGVRQLSNLGGAPGLIVLLGAGGALIRLMMLGPDYLNGRSQAGQHRIKSAPAD